MIDSGIFTKSAIFTVDSFQTEQIVVEDSAVVAKSTIWHLICAHLSEVFADGALCAQQKLKTAHSFGFTLGSNLAEEDCLGFVKYNQSSKTSSNGKEAPQREFLSEMKIVNSKIWQTLVGSKGKLFAVTDKDKGICFKIEDMDFGLGKSTKKQLNDSERQYRKMLKEYCLGIVKGSLSRFDLLGDIIISEGANKSIHVDMQNLRRQNPHNNYEQYTKQIQNQTSFI